MKNVKAYKTIGEVEQLLKVKPHVLRFWEESFSQIKPLKRKGGRRLYSEDIINTLTRNNTTPSVFIRRRRIMRGIRQSPSSKRKLKMRKSKRPPVSQNAIFSSVYQLTLRGV